VSCAAGASGPTRKLYAGSGKVEEIARAVADLNAAWVIFDHALSPAQQRNLERQLKCRGFDRTELILDIFAHRARSHEGKLQVELARLQHLSTAWCAAGATSSASAAASARPAAPARRRSSSTGG
jgi:50S ribosomal subunit-associated GTPase HflX